MATRPAIAQVQRVWYKGDERSYVSVLKKRGVSMKTLTVWSWPTAVILLFLFTPYVYAGSLDEEAKKEIMVFYFSKRLITKCGNDLYSYLGIKNQPALEGVIVELKGLSAEVKSQPLSNADKLNGVEWKGSGNIRQEAWRMYHEKTGWSSWQSPPLNESGRLFLDKKKGRWIVIPNGSLEEIMSFAKPIACEKLATIPKPK